MSLPPLPVDDSSLDLYWRALHPSEDEERSSIGEVLDLLAEMGGSDLSAVKEQISDDTVMMRDERYHPNELIVALIEEIRRLRRPPRYVGGMRDDPLEWN